MDDDEAEQITQELKEAEELWNAVMFACSPMQLDCAQQKLKESPLRVQLAVMHAVISRWQLNRIPSPEENPFKTKLQDDRRQAVIERSDNPATEVTESHLKIY